MDKENLWQVCDHILLESADEIELKSHQIAICKACATLPPYNIETLESVPEGILKDLIKDMDIVVGAEYLDKKE